MSLSTMLARTLKQDTNDAVIREALKAELTILHAKDRRLRIIEEFGVRHGSARVDIAVVNGVLHGYEIKSDRDTLLRLPEQMDAYNAVFDQVTLVVGKSHLYEAMHAVPDWWGIKIAKVQDDQSVYFCVIREARENPMKDSIAIAQLLWRQEALNILDDKGAAIGLRSKSRAQIYERLTTIFDQESLREKVRETLFFRDWRSDSPLVLNGD